MNELEAESSIYPCHLIKRLSILDAHKHKQTIYKLTKPTFWWQQHDVMDNAQQPRIHHASFELIHMYLYAHNKWVACVAQL